MSEIQLILSIVSIMLVVATALFGYITIVKHILEEKITNLIIANNNLGNETKNLSNTLTNLTRRVEEMSAIVYKQRAEENDLKKKESNEQ
jgi:predicted PurR-regulated permease PerM